MTIRPIHHLVLPVTTLNLARGRLESLGFTVAPDAAHPFGTGNCCVFFANGTYIEPLTVVDRNKADMAAAEGVQFVLRSRRFTERHGEGFAMLALQSDQIEADQSRFAAAGFALGTVFHFDRNARLPDGSEQSVGVDLAFAADAAAPDATIFTCRLTDAEALWNPAYAEHPNGATGVTSVAAVAENPADFHILLSTVSGQRELNATSFGVEAKVGNGTISILTPAGFEARYGVAPPDPRQGLLLAAFDLGTSDPGRALSFGGPSSFRRADRIVIPPSPGLGVVCSFEIGHHG